MGRSWKSIILPSTFIMGYVAKFSVAFHHTQLLNLDITRVQSTVCIKLTSLPPAPRVRRGVAALRCLRHSGLDLVMDLDYRQKRLRPTSRVNMSMAVITIAMLMLAGAVGSRSVYRMRKVLMG